VISCFSLSCLWFLHGLSIWERTVEHGRRRERAGGSK
jgi:hypothetical protein